jgi:hypothetical protein
VENWLFSGSTNANYAIHEARNGRLGYGSDALQMLDFTQQIRLDGAKIESDHAQRKDCTILCAER